MFTPDPPVDALCALPILRCAPNVHLDCILVCDQFTGVLTHYLKEETALHTIEGPCLGCDAGQAPRWQGFIIVAGTSSGYHRLLQFTPPVARVFKKHRSTVGSLAGVVARLRRAGSERNSPLHAEVTDYTKQEAHFSFEQLQMAVSRLFRHNYPLFEAARATVGSLPTE